MDELHRATSVLSSAVRPFMLWNTFLALVPCVMSIALFRSGARRTPMWWGVFVTWIAFLPNAPYVITDVVHLVDDMQRTPGDRHGYALLLVYGGFFAFGLGLYACSTFLFRRTLVTWIGAGRAGMAIVALHAACAVGIYLGRFGRVNSWDVVVAPASVGEHVAGVDRPFAIVVIVALFATLLVATSVMHGVVRVGVDTVARLRAPRA